MIPLDVFPNLNAENHRVTSSASLDYNCVAWSASDTEHWWQPGIFWPVALSKDDHGIGALEQAFLALGYQECDNGRLEPGFEKVALYGSGLIYLHAARQLPDLSGLASWANWKILNTTHRTTWPAAGTVTLSNS